MNPLRRLGQGATPEQVADAVEGWAGEQGLTLYPHQEEALLELLAGNHVVLATPTGSGKSLVGIAAHAAALARGEVSVYTAPIKALVSEKFFALCEVFGAEDVGMLTGDAAVNPDAPVLCCTAEVLANMALREGRRADVGVVVMDEFHFYAEPGRGWAWQVPLLELADAQFLLMSATLGDVTELAADLTARTGRDVARVEDAPRPVPLTFAWSLDPVEETLEELVTTGQAPVYVVHFTQAAAVEHAVSLLTARWAGTTGERAAGLRERLAGVRFAAGFGATLRKLLRHGIGVHHAGMLPRYRRLVEQLAQAGLLRVVCGTDTLGVGINVPIRTVLFTGLVKFDGSRQRVLRVREFQQIAGRAGRAGYDTAGHVVVQAPEHVIENERAKAKAEARNSAPGANAKRRSKAQLKKPPSGTVVWTEQTFTKLVEGRPEPLVSRMKVDHAVLVNVLAREEDAFAVMRRLLMDNHEPRARQLSLARRALRLTRSLVASGLVTRLDEVDRFGRRYVLTVDLPPDFALNQPLAHFALEALDLLARPEEAGDPGGSGGELAHALDVVSVVEAVLEAPMPLLLAQQHAARGALIGELKADGVPYEERMELVEEVTWPRPLADLLEPAYETYRGAHPWLPEDALAPKSVVRHMVEDGMGFSDLVRRYQLARSEGLVLRYLTDAYRTLRQSVPERHRSEAFEEIVEWLGEVVRQTDSSLLDEWEQLTGAAPIGAAGRGEAAPPGTPTSQRPLSGQERALGVMVRTAVFRRVSLWAADDVAGLVALDRAGGALADPPRPPLLDEDAWDAVLEDYYAEHDRVEMGPDARSPRLLEVARTPGLLLLDEDAQAWLAGASRRWEVRQTVPDPEGHHDWVVDAVVDLDATDAVGEPVLTVVSARRL